MAAFVLHLLVLLLLLTLGSCFVLLLLLLLLLLPFVLFPYVWQSMTRSRALHKLLCDFQEAATAGAVAISDVR